MVDVIPDMPPGTLGFRVSGRLTRDDYGAVLVPPLREAVEAELGIKHRDAWKRIAVVSDVGWLWRAFQLFSWMVPGEMRLFRESEFEQAKTWLAE
jgi:hypothetical protein